MEYTEIPINGKIYKFARLSPQVLGQKFVAWAKTVLPNALDDIAPKLALFPLEIQKEMVKEAMSKARMPLTMQSPEVQALTNTFEGAGKAAALRLQEAHPELTDADCFDLLFQAGEEHGPEKLAELLA